MIYLIAKLDIQPGSFNAVKEAVLPCLEATRKEEGCLSYELYHSIENPDRLVFVERWKSKEALDLHFATSHLKVWREKASPYFLSRKIEIVYPDRIEIL